MFAVHVGSLEFGPTGARPSVLFSDLIDQDIRTQYALSWKRVVSQWRSHRKKTSQFDQLFLSVR